MKIQEIEVNESFASALSNAGVAYRIHKALAAEKDKDKQTILKRALEMALKGMDANNIQHWIDRSMKLVKEDTCAGSIAAVAAPLFVEPISRIPKKKKKKVAEGVTPTVTKAETTMNPGVNVGDYVSIKAPGYDWMVVFGKFMRVGRSGLAHVHLNEPLESNGEIDIAVPVSWLYASVEDAMPNPYANKNSSVSEDLEPNFVNKQVNKKEWKKLGRGEGSSIWMHMSDPDTVVKLVGGGFGGPFGRVSTAEKTTQIAFVDFLVHYGHESKHFPIVHGINTDDQEVVQIRMEVLSPLKHDTLGEYIGELAYYTYDTEMISSIDKCLRELGTLRVDNCGQSIAEAMRTLRQHRVNYSKKYNLDIKTDIHEYNVMKRADGTIVLSDPWFGGFI